MWNVIWTCFKFHFINIYFQNVILYMVSFAFWGEIWSVFARSTQDCLRLWLWSYLLSFQRLCYGDIFSIEAVHRDPAAVVKAWCTCDVQHPIGCVRRLHIVTCMQNHTATFTTTQLTQPHSHLQQSACLTRNSWGPNHKLFHYSRHRHCWE